MSVVRKGLLLAGASVVAVGMSMSGAQAFSNLEWNYGLNVNGWVDFDIDIGGYFDPQGLVAVEALQIQLGDVTATSIVHGVTNNAPNGESQTYTIDLGSVTHVIPYLSSWDNSGELVDENGELLEGEISCKALGPCTLDLGHAVITIDGVGDVLYAPVHLPEVVSTATAVGNNLSIEGPTFTTFDVTQGLSGDNFFNTAEINADSSVWDIQNASVDSAATAVGNNLSVALQTVADTTNSDLIAIGDLTQFSHANVSANSFVADVTVSNYSGLGGDLGRNLVSSVSTAVGNNASISVSVGGNN